MVAHQVVPNSIPSSVLGFFKLTVVPQFIRTGYFRFSVSSTIFWHSPIMEVAYYTWSIRTSLTKGRLEEEIKWRKRKKLTWYIPRLGHDDLNSYFLLTENYWFAESCSMLHYPGVSQCCITLKVLNKKLEWYWFHINGTNITVLY